MLAILLACILPLVAQAPEEPQQPAVEMTTTSRIYYPERMGFPGNTPVLDVMLAIVDGRASNPEEIVRNYRIKYNGAFIIEDLVVFLSNLRVNDVEKICYNNNQTVTEGAQGLLGTIAITAKQIEEGTHGFADVSVTSNEDSRSTVRVKMHQGRWDASGHVSWRRQASRKTLEQQISFYGQKSMDAIKDIDGNRFMEDAYLNINYNGDRNFLSLLLTQQYGHKKGNEMYGLTLDDELFGKYTTFYDHHTRLATLGLVWDHAFTEKTHFEGYFQESFSNSPSTYTDNYEGTEYDNFVFKELDYKFLPKTFGTYGEIRFSSREIDKLFMVGGMDYSFDQSHSDENVFTDVNTELRQKYCLHSYLVSPHLDVTYNLGALTLSTGYRMNLLRYEARLGKAPHWHGNYQNPMWNTFSSWDIDKQNKLIASYSHRIMEQDITEMYPEQIFRLGDNVTYTRGDENLKLPTFDIFDLSYATNHEHASLLLKGRYYVSRNAITTTTVNDAISDSGVEYDYDRSVNGPKVTGLNLDAELYLRYRWLSITVAAAYNHLEYQDADNAHYWMVRVLPVLTLPYGFNMTGALSYHTSSSTPTLHTKAYWYGRMRLNKDIGEHWSLYAQWDNPLKSKITTTEYDENMTTRIVENLHDSQWVFGIFYAF